MKKIIKALIGIFVVVSMTILLMGNLKNETKDNTVEIWWYEYENEHTYNSIMSSIINVIVYNSNAHGMPAKEVKYSYKEISYSDYVFKRNIALSTKNAFTIDDAKNLYSLQNYHADYDRLENYKKDSYFAMLKEKYCVPMGMYNECVLLNKDIFNYYNIDISVDKLYTYSEFLEFRQRLKEKGARFKLSKQEYYYTIDYYIDKYKLNSSDLCKSKDIGEIEYSQLLEKTILDIYNDFDIYYSDEFNYDILMGNDVEESVESNTNEIYDDVSKQILMSTKRIRPFNVVDYNKATTEFGNKVPVLIDNYYAKGKIKSPCIFIYKRNHDENVYKIANELLTDGYYNMMLPKNYYGGKDLIYLPTQNSIMTLKLLGVDENFMSNTYMATFAKLGYKKIAEQMNLINVVTSNVMNDSNAKEQLMTNFSRGESIDYLYIFIIEELNKLNENKENIDKLKESINSYTKNYFIRIK